MRHALSVSLCCLALGPAWAHAGPPRDADNSVYLELGGSGAVYSLNYERFVLDDLALRIGFGYVSIEGSFNGGTEHTALVTIPMTASYLGLGVGNHRLELGAGAVIADVTGSGVETFGSSGVLGTAIAGYRYVRPGGGFTFRAAFTPLFVFVAEGFEPWAGVAFGFGF